MDYQNCRNLAAMFYAEAARQGDKPFLWAKRDGAFRSLSWARAAVETANLAKGLRQLGLRPGDRVALVSENRPEWVIADLAAITAGGITVPAYVTHTVDDHRHLLTDCGASLAIVSSLALARRVAEAASQAPSVKGLVVMETLLPDANLPVAAQSWDAVLARGASAADDVADWVAEIAREDLACLIYTSGTGGLPKGVMTSHANILANCGAAYQLLEKLDLGDEIFLSFLPMSHSYEHTAGMMFPISLGAQIYFAEGADSLAANLLEARPTVMTAVPRLYEAFHQRILRAIEREGGFKAKLFFKALALGRKRLADPASLTLSERLIDRVLDRLVRDKVRARFGGRLKALVSGGAPLNPEIGRFFLALGVRLLQGYGQTEASPVISANPPDRIRIETVGPAVDGVEVDFAADGEILVRGPSVMKGYWNDEAATSRALAGGWLHTGDVGARDPDGYIRITDRKKDFIKTSGGDMIAPARIETQLTLQPEIGQAIVLGDQRPFLVALLVPNQELQGHAPDRIVKEVAAAVTRVNGGLPTLERIRRYKIVAAFTTANGQMTPTLKIRRHVIRQAYAAELDSLYEKSAG
jgi:long-chain acyl-CoA synthetase